MADIQNTPSIRIHVLTQAQYEQLMRDNQIDENALYLIKPAS